MKVRVYKPSLTLSLICILAICYLFKCTYFVNQSDVLTNILDYFETAIYILMIVKIALSGYKVKEIVVIAAIVVALGVCYITTGQADLFKASIVIVYLNGESERDVYGNLFQALLLATLIILLFYVLGFSDPGIGRRNGITVGFTQVNVASRMIQTTVFAWLIAKRKDSKFFRMLIVAELTALYIVLTTRSRASAIIVAIFPIMFFLAKKILSLKRTRVLKFILASLPVIFLILTFAVSKLYANNALIQYINEAYLSNRIYMNYVALDNYGVSILGQVGNISSLNGIYNSVTDSYVNFLTIDSLYTYIIVYYGIVGTLVWIIVNIATFLKAWKHNNAAILTILILLNIYSLTETMSSIFVFLPLMYMLVKTNDEESREFGLKNKRYLTESVD